MALVRCWECGCEISDSAESCPGCGAPTATAHDGETAPPSTVDIDEPAAPVDAFFAEEGLAPPPPPPGMPEPLTATPPSTIHAPQQPSPAAPILGIVGVALGLAALILPYFAAVFLVPAAFICGLVAFVRRQRVLGVAAMIAACIGLIGVLYVSQQITSIVKDPFAPNAITGSGSTPVVTLAEYEQAETGMSYEKVVAVVGASGQEMSRSEADGYSVVMYYWSNDNGSNMNAMFENGKLSNKAQVGLR